MSLASAPSPPAAAGLSIVVPVYNEAAGLPDLHRRLIEVARDLRAALERAWLSREGGCGPGLTPASPGRRVVAEAVPDR